MSYNDRNKVLAWLDAGNGERIAVRNDSDEYARIDQLRPIDRILLIEYAEKTLRKKGHKMDGWAWPGDDFFEKRYGWKRRTLEDARRRLREFGLLNTEGGRRGDNARHRVTLPDQRKEARKPTSQRGQKAA